MKKYIHFLLLTCVPTLIFPVWANDMGVMSEFMKRRLARAASVPDNLQNPGFEDVGTAGKLPGWTDVAHAGDQYRIEQDQDQAFSGKRSLLIENTGKPSWGGAVQVIRAERLAGQEVELSAQVKSLGVTTPGFSIMLKITQMGRELEVVKTHKKIIGYMDWESVNLSATLPKETTHLEVMLMLEGDGSVWVDNVRLIHSRSAI